MADVVVVDSGPFVALFDRDDQYHRAALRFVKKTPSRLVSTVAIVTEVMYVLDFDLRAQLAFLKWLSAGEILLVEPTIEDFERGAVLMQKYADRPMDFGDAMLVAVCERLNVRRIATVDSDFEFYRFKNRARFENLMSTRS